MLLSVHVTSVLFLVWFNNFALTKGSIWVTCSYSSRLFLCALGAIHSPYSCHSCHSELAHKPSFLTLLHSCEIMHQSCKQYHRKRDSIYHTVQRLVALFPGLPRFCCCCCYCCCFYLPFVFTITVEQWFKNKEGLGAFIDRTPFAVFHHWSSFQTSVWLKLLVRNPHSS